jgi:uroporphyrinogen decarboxylase
VSSILPIQHPKPDYERFIRIIKGEVQGERTPLIEYIIDDVHQKAIATDLLGRQWVEYGPGKAREAYWDNFIAMWYHLGYDFVRLELGAGFQSKRVVGEDATRADQTRGWADEHQGAIENWVDFESYPWPDVEKLEMWDLQYITSHLPEGMGFITNHAGGIFENVTQIMSYEKFCMALYDDPELVKALVQKVGEIMEAYYLHLAELPNVIAFFPGDDMGFRSGTLASPKVLRELFLPWHTRFARIAHAKGIPYFLHSCGQLLDIYEDLIETVKIDAKHSFEDAILPAPEFQKLYGDRIGVLGGVDVHILAAGTVDDVRKRTRELIDICGAKGRFAVGAGNSVPSYIPLENYLAMVEEALQ